ncbi:SET domain-containing protein [Pinibacter soli]|uniref:SET domain-containing protein-lysine N-methyltransferase n=1 Tax=Pinibacter soli TaxID=3044211 RepID=A0ABT6RG48_9BACT|nr:SET domain-containing protein-lysine N-methyltransferase [Pinibacter soli]MDI3321551.1 SET domain-containing protein-lysine N-methyltransferase [Pinibacter soli]
MSLTYKLESKKSKIDGTGTFALQNIPAKKKLGNMGGEIVSLRKARLLVASQKRIACVEFGDGRALNGSVNKNELNFINHSCGPNTYMRVAHGKVEFYTLKPIKKGEELTCNYGETHHDGKLKCRCGAPNCKGFI